MMETVVTPVIIDPTDTRAAPLNLGATNAPCPTSWGVKTSNKSPLVSPHPKPSQSTDWSLDWRVAEDLAPKEFRFRILETVSRAARQQQPKAAFFGGEARTLNKTSRAMSENEKKENIAQPLRHFRWKTFTRTRAMPWCVHVHSKMRCSFSTAVWMHN